MREQREETRKEGGKNYIWPRKQENGKKIERKRKWKKRTEKKIQEREERARVKRESRERARGECDQSNDRGV